MQWDTIIALAQRCGVKHETARKWRTRGHVPGNWHLVLLQAAEDEGVKLAPSDLLNGRQRETA